MEFYFYNKKQTFNTIIEQASIGWSEVINNQIVARQSILLDYWKKMILKSASNVNNKFKINNNKALLF